MEIYWKSHLDEIEKLYQRSGIAPKARSEIEIALKRINSWLQSGVAKELGLQNRESEISITLKNELDSLKRQPIDASGSRIIYKALEGALKDFLDEEQITAIMNELRDSKKKSFVDQALAGLSSQPVADQILTLRRDFESGLSILESGLSIVSGHIALINKKIEAEGFEPDAFKKLYEAAKADSEQAATAARKQLDDTNAIIQGLTRQGISKAFSLRAAALANKQRLYELIFAIILVIAVSTAFWVGSSSTVMFTNWSEIITKVLVGLAVIWGGWYTGRMSLICSRVREDYEFKAAVSLSYSGYRDEIEKADATLVPMFIQSIIKVIGDNPARLYPHTKQMHGHPAESMAHAIADAVKAKIKPDAS